MKNGMVAALTHGKPGDRKQTDKFRKMSDLIDALQKVPIGHTVDISVALTSGEVLVLCRPGMSIEYSHIVQTS